LLLTPAPKPLTQEAMTIAKTKQSATMRLAKYHFPVLLYAALILYLSSLPSVKVPVKLPLGVDKLAHLVEYALFAWMVFRSFHDLIGAYSTRLVVVIGSAFIMIFAILDEMFQGTIPGRHQDPVDLAMDFVGGVVVLVVLGLRTNRTPANDKSI
jgi:VanZ family protein